MHSALIRKTNIVAVVRVEPGDGHRDAGLQLHHIAWQSEIKEKVNIYVAITI